MHNLRSPSASGLLAAIGAIFLTGWALAQQGLVVEFGGLQLLPTQTSIQGPGVQMTRSLILGIGDSPETIAFSFSESDGSCPPLNPDLAWIEVFSNAEEERLPGRILGSIEPGQAATLEIVFDSSGLDPGDFLSATLCVEYHQEFAGINPPPPQLLFFDELAASLQVVEPVQDVPALSAWSCLALALLLLGWGASRLL